MVDGGYGGGWNNKRKKKIRTPQTSAYSGKEGFGGHEGGRRLKKINVRQLFFGRRGLWGIALFWIWAFAFALVMMRL